MMKAVVVAVDAGAVAIVDGVVVVAAAGALVVVAAYVTGNLPQFNDPTMISVGTKVMVMLLLQYSQQ